MIIIYITSDDEMNTTNEEIKRPAANHIKNCNIEIFFFEFESLVSIIINIGDAILFDPLGVNLMTLNWNWKENDRRQQ